MDFYNIQRHMQYVWVLSSVEWFTSRCGKYIPYVQWLIYLYKDYLIKYVPFEHKGACLVIKEIHFEKSLTKINYVFLFHIITPSLIIFFKVPQTKEEIINVSSLKTK